MRLMKMFGNLEKLEYFGNLTQSEAKEKAKEIGGRILLNREIDGLVNHELITLRPELLPVWTGTHLDYDGTKCLITENGKSVERSMPEKDGWYEQDEFGLPFGKESGYASPTARKLWRLNKNSGLVSRYYDGWYDWFRRCVICDDGPTVRLGVFVVRGEKS